MNSNDMKEELSKIEHLTVGTISSLGTVVLYGAGVNLSRSFANGRPIFIGTVILSFIAPHLLKSSTTYLLTKHHQKQKSRGKL